MAAYEGYDQGSPVDGFKVSDFDVTCINDPNKVCPARQILVRQYVGEVGISDNDGSISAVAFADREILVLKLLDHTVHAGITKCVDATETFCPPRQAMNNNPVRKMGVKTTRKIMNIFGIRGH